MKGLENMKVLLLKDVYKLGRAGDVKKVADGFGRNFLIPQKLAILATPGTVKQADRIRANAAATREALNEEMSGVAEKITGLQLTFAAKAGETEKLYGSVTTQMLAESLSEKAGVEISRRQIDVQPLRMLGEFKIPVRLTVDLVPEISVVVYREGESAEKQLEASAAKAAALELEEAAEIDYIDEIEEMADSDETPTEEEIDIDTEDSEE